MFRGFRNIKYYFDEVGTILKLNGLSSFLSIISLMLIFFITALTLSGWWLSNEFANALKDQAEISIYYPTNLNEFSLNTLVEEIQLIDGVKHLEQITAEDAYQNMSKILGQEAKILSQFEENPFEAYFEVSIELNKLDFVLEELKNVDKIEYVRDNRTVLEKIEKITTVVGIIGVIMTLAVGISTFIITSHIIREGVHAHRNQINTLQLLGAPDRFIQMPFIIEGTLLTFISGVFASALYVLFSLNFSKMTVGIFPFFPAVDKHALILIIGLSLMGASFILGITASLFGLKLVKNK